MIATEQLPDLDATDDFAACWAAFQPPPLVRMLPWAEANVVTDLGRPYDRSTYPHLSAPGGPMDAFDASFIRTISLQWGVRLGKTFFGQCCFCKTAHTKPAPMIFVSPREKLGREQVSRLYEMLRKSTTLRGLLAKHQRLQKQDLVEFVGCKAYVGWAKSAATLADKKCVIGHATEVDKWEHSQTSTEGHPYDLFLDRFNDDYIVRKIITEGTPSIKGRSTIERLRLAGSNCRYEVPCPLCRRYQAIEWGTPETKWGLKWDVPGDGKRDVDLARRTARYVCRYCEQAITSEYRPWMMRRGVWCPEGATVRDEIALEIVQGREPYEWQGWSSAAWIAGTPARDGEDASFHLATLCALNIPEWGDFAKRFLQAVAKKQSFRSFVNQWWAQTWEDAERKTTWEQLGERLISEIPRHLVPAGYSVLTCGVDKQIDHYVYCVDAWNADLCSHTVAYGTFPTLEALESEIFSRRWPCADGGSLQIVMTLIDTGFRPAEVYRFCRKRKKRVLPSKGSSHPLSTFVIRRTLGKKTSSPGQRIALVDTQSTQDWIDKQLHVLRPGEPETHTIYAGSLGEHQDFLEQLLNDAPIAEIDSSNNFRERWRRIDEHTPNDYRDTRRYSFGAFQLHTRGSRPVASTRRRGINTPATPAGIPGPPRGAPKFPRVPLFKSK